MSLILYPTNKPFQRRVLQEPLGTALTSRTIYLYTTPLDAEKYIQFIIYMNWDSVNVVPS